MAKKRETEAAWLFKNHAGYVTFAQEREEKKKKIAGIGLSEDTKIRMEIQAIIRKLAAEGKTKRGILNRINVKFMDEKYSKYRAYFEKWVDHELEGKKTVKEKQTSQEEQEER